jgi:hypothetical protein
VIARIGNFEVCKAAFERALWSGRLSIWKCARGRGSLRSRKKSRHKAQARFRTRPATSSGSIPAAAARACSFIAAARCRRAARTSSPAGLPAQARQWAADAQMSSTGSTDSGSVNSGLCSRRARRSSTVTSGRQRAFNRLVALRSRVVPLTPLYILPISTRMRRMMTTRPRPLEG